MGETNALEVPTEFHVPGSEFVPCVGRACNLYWVSLLSLRNAAKAPQILLNSIAGELCICLLIAVVKKLGILKDRG